MESERAAQSSSALDFLPPQAHPSLNDLAAAAQGCRGCDLWERGTQTVFGTGSPGAEIMLVGEQPGDQEDRRGLPFVGPAGRLLDDALTEAGIDREKTYVTNAVKHFKWEARGKRRIHKAPDRYEIGACRPWLRAELLVVKPRVIVAMGVTAARSILDRQVAITKERGTVTETDGGIPVTLTVHPSSILRSRDEEERRAAVQLFIADLRVASGVIR